MNLIKKYEGKAKEFCEFAKLCYERNLVKSDGGNVSIRIPEDDIYLVTASGISLRDTNLFNILFVNGNGEILEGDENLRPSKELGFHMVLYRSSIEIQSIIHVHPVFSIIYANRMTKIPYPTVSAEKKLFQFGVVTKEEPGSPLLGDEILTIFNKFEKSFGVLLMEGHGIVSVHKSLQEAFDLAELAEDTARIAFYESLKGK